MHWRSTAAGAGGAYPLTQGTAHGDFGEMARFGMQRHAMFRPLAPRLKADPESTLDRSLDFATCTARLERGFDLFERDHVAIYGSLKVLAQDANAVMPDGAVVVVHHRFPGIEIWVNRHPTDEADIVVPVVLHSGFRG